MGGNQSNLPQKPLGFEYMCIAVRSLDKLRIVLGGDYEISIMRQVIQETWPKGIQEETFRMNGVHEFKLKGFPFSSGSSSSNAIACRRMVERILHRLYRDGWKLQMSSNLTQTEDMTTWFFRKVPVASFPSKPFLVVGLSSYDSLMIMNASMDLHQLFKNAIEKSWPKGIQKWTYENDVLVVKLKGYAWRPDGEDTVHSRVLINTIIADLFQQQWKLYGNSNFKSDANTFFFEHDPNLPVGQPSPMQFVISFNSHDLLRVIGAPENLISAVRNTIQGHWVRGIQRESSYAGSWEFKLKGTPWWADGQEAVESRYLVLKVMESLQAYGWSPIAAIDSSRKDSDKSALIFRQSQPRQSPFFCISLNETDKLRLINTPDDVTKLCQDVIQAQYVLGTQRVQMYGKSLEFKLLCNPWSCGINGHDGLHGRNLLCHLISALGSLRWAPVLSADVSAKYIHQDKGDDYPIDVDSLFFTYDPATDTGPPSVPPPFAQPYSQGFGQPYPQPPPQGFGQPYPQPPPQGFGQPYPHPPPQGFGQPYPPPPAYGFASQGAPPPLNPAYGAFPPQ
ncbi:uncharacterized protein [Montipora capricornis]|uniref:uncharacterized protein n=1 Tax=Montipora capricornis TaxID=246305 RepID=UPI0035F1B186